MNAIRELLELQVSTMTDYQLGAYLTAVDSAGGTGDELSVLVSEASRRLQVRPRMQVTP